MKRNQVGLRWLGQSGFVLRFSSATVLIDAFLSPHRDRLVPAPFLPADATGFDIIACTHEHLDHLDLAALPDMAKASPTARVVVPAACVDMVAMAGVPRDRVVGMQPAVPCVLCGITIHALPARHGLHPADAYNFGEALTAGSIRYLGYVICSDGIAVYHAGDTIDYEGLAQRLKELAVDVALLPINGRDATREAMDIVGNMNEAEAADLATAAQVRVAVPMHYDMFAANPGSPALFVAAVQSRHPGLTVVVPERGEEFVYTKSIP